MVGRGETDFDWQTDPAGGEAGNAGDAENRSASDGGTATAGDDATTDAAGDGAVNDAARDGTVNDAADVPDYDPPAHAYPPDALFEGWFPISFTATVALLAVLASAASVYRVGFPETPVPYNYPLFVGAVYVIAVLFVLRKYHAVFEATKRDLADVLDRTEAHSVVVGRDDDGDDLTPEELVADFERVMDLVFHPRVIFAGGLVGGVFTLAVMSALDVFDAYPYLFLNYAYGAGHGFFWGPLFGSAYLVYKISTEYIVDVDVLAPDGVGGYRGVGDAIVTLVTYGIGLVTLDFVILSSASFLDRPVFRTAVLAVYGLMLGFLLLVTVLGIGLFRRRLLAVREQKIEALRAKFKAVEANYWRKLDRNESPEPEATHIDTMNTMFEKLQNMALWPINLKTFAKLVVTTLGSLSVALVETWLKTGEVPAVVSWLLP